MSSGLDHRGAVTSSVLPLHSSDDEASLRALRAHLNQRMTALEDERAALVKLQEQLSTEGEKLSRLQQAQSAG